MSLDLWFPSYGRYAQHTGFWADTWNPMIIVAYLLTMMDIVSQYTPTMMGLTVISALGTQRDPFDRVLA